MKRKTKIILASIVFILVALMLWVANGFLGNPVSKFIANKSAIRYIEKTYPEMDLELGEPKYNFKNGRYNIPVNSSGSIDTSFSIDVSLIGKIKNDSYENYVLSGFNTWQRINREYREIVNNLFESQKFTYKTNIYFGEIKIKEESEDSFGPSYGLNLERLALDKIYDIGKIASEAGHLVVYLEDEELNAGRASEILLDIKNLFDSENIPFYAVDISLEKPIEEGEKNQETFKVREFLYSDIYEKDLDARVGEAARELEKYYKKQDGIGEGKEDE